MAQVRKAVLKVLGVRSGRVMAAQTRGEIGVILRQVVRGPARDQLRRLYASVLLLKLWLRTRDRDLLKRARTLQALSRSCFGWTTTHPIRWWEYPWVLREVERRLEGRARTALDAGAGKSPMPLALARLGLSTVAIDPDSQEQTSRYCGGEWDWTDYERWGVETRRAGIEDQVFQTGTLGFAVSVSVIEHLPRRVRRKGLAQIAAALEPGGVLVLTVDLIPGTRELWNRILDEEVEPASIHGTVDSLIGEAQDVKLRLEHQERCPIPGAKADVLGLVFRRQAR